MSDTPISLLDRLRHRPDDSSWKRLVDLYTPLIHSWTRRYFLQVSDRDDLVQEVLAALVRELPNFRHNGRPGAFRCWLRAITLNRLRSSWQTRTDRAVGNVDTANMLDELEDPSSNLSRLWDQEHDLHVVGQLLKMIEPEFSPTTWQAFRRLMLDGLEADRVAAEFGMSVNAVCIAKSRVLGRLRQEAAELID